MPKNRDYNRPNQNWECGWAKDGKACPRGPGPGGKCDTKSECQPFKDGDRFHCARVPQRGGKCEQGPNPDGTCCLAIPPCQPVRSLRAKRGLFALAATGLALGVVLIALGTSPRPNHFLSPGPLSNHHRAIQHDCATCHGGSTRLPAAWLTEGRDPHRLSQNCVACHSTSDHPFNIHSMKPETLAEVTKKHKGVVPAGDPRQMECATCHKEHKGGNSKLVALSNQQCQSCHAQKFAGFSKDHPGFENYPFRRRTRILFDHSAHFGKYFGQKDKKDINCSLCHTPDENGGRMALVGFSKSCAECHEPTIRGAEQTAKGIAFWRLPTVDIKALASSNIGSWPEDADGKLTPYQRLLLLGDERFAEAYTKVASLDLADLGSADAEEKRAAARVIWGLKAIPAELASEGGPYLQKHLEKALERTFTPSEITGLMGSMPVEVLRGAMNAWFPGGEAELKAWGEKRPPATKKLPSHKSSDEGDESWTEHGGWYRKTADFTIKFRPRGHEDAFMVSWIHLAEENKKASPVLKKALAALVDPKTPGTCMKCHSVDQSADETLTVNWKGKNRENEPPGFSKFAHSAHFSLLQKDGCVTCHTVNDKVEFDKNTDGHDPNVFSSNFLPIKKEACVTCHNGTDRVGDTCQSCHNYHTPVDRRRISDFQKVKTKM